MSAVLKGVIAQQDVNRPSLTLPLLLLLLLLLLLPATGTQLKYALGIC
jgi:hypothetical protein